MCAPDVFTPARTLGDSALPQPAASLILPDPPLLWRRRLRPDPGGVVDRSRPRFELESCPKHDRDSQRADARHQRGELADDRPSAVKHQRSGVAALKVFDEVERRD